MVGWIPREPLLRQEKLVGLIARVERSQLFELHDKPVILQYDDRSGDLSPWSWPLEGGVPVGPDQLDRHRYTHYFKGPQCLCAFKNGTTGFNEAKIGLVQAIQPGAANCLGQYVAACATQQCGYFVRLERYFGHPNLQTVQFGKREKAIVVMDPFHFLTDDTEETIRRTGLRQIQVLRDDSNTGLRGTNRLLKREDPERFLELQDMLKQLLLKGLPADSFWDMFVQCIDCRFVMPRQYFPYYHQCVVQVVHPQLGIPRGIPAPEAMEDVIDDILSRDDIDDIPGPASSDASLAPVASLFGRPQFPWVNPNAEPVTPKRPAHQRR